ncbi:MAG: CBS domain-containing protein [Halanaeroarchaeum sp.]
MDVQDIMTTDLVTATREESLQAAVSRMLDHRVGSVIVVDGSEPVGIVTETDVLAVGTTYERPFAEIPVTRAMSGNPVTIAPDTSLESAIDTLHDHGIKKLPVVSDGELVGVVTMTDFVYQQHDLVGEVEKLERERQRALEGVDVEE